MSDDDRSAPALATARGGLDDVLRRVREEGLAVLPTAHGAVVCLPETRYEALLRVALRGGEGAPHRTGVSLTPRERQVILLMADGRSTADTAAALGVALNTVAQHLAAVRSKYEVRSTAAAIAAARSDGHL